MPRGTPIDLSSGNKLCPKCKTVKPLANFHKSKATITGYQVYCIYCSRTRHGKWRRKNLPKMRDASKKWRTENPKRARDHILRSTYGLPLGMYDTMFTAQNGLCAICNKPSINGRGRLHVDHCHQSGRIRGLLCHGCNVSIGHFKHDSAILRAAIDYLAKGG